MTGFVGRRRLVQAGALMLPADTVARAASAQSRVKSGTLEIEQVQVAFVGSGNVGGGTLHFQDQSYRFTVGGLGVGGFGVSKMQAYGDVFNLRELRQFPGAYVQARYGATAGTASTGEMWLENSSGVSISLRTKRAGLAVSMGGDAVYIDFK
jgi:hypothetical protein